MAGRVALAPGAAVARRHVALARGLVATLERPLLVGFSARGAPPRPAPPPAQALLSSGADALAESRGLSTRVSVAELLPDQWRSDEYVRTPPVRLFDGAAEPPTAISWLRRRADVATASASASSAAVAPPPASALYRLFRERQVRLARLVVEDEGEGEGDGAGHPKVRVTRISSPSRRLDEGDVLLAPRAAFGVAAAKPSPPPPPPLATTTSVRPSDVRAWIVAKYPDFVVLNKPAGVKVHGLEPGPRGGDPATLDLRTGVLRRALGARGGDENDGDGPRPVHRLDQRASGCLVVARDRDAAAWLGRAFENSSSSGVAAERREDERAASSPSSPPSSSSSSPSPPPPRVEKTYLALVELGKGISDGEWLISPRKTGTIRTRGLIDGRVRSCVTKYRVLAVGGRRERLRGGGGAGEAGAPGATGAAAAAALLELSPVTGTKHQLRRHCAHQLGAPIVGDWRYGWRDGAEGGGGGGGGGEGSDEGDEGEGDGAPSPLLLHSSRLVVYRPGGPPLRAVAPLPPYWRAALRARGIEVPRG